MALNNCDDKTISKDYLQIGSQKSQEVIIDVIEPSRSCLRFTTEEYIDTDSASDPIWDKDTKPEDALTCSGPCAHTGFLYLEAAAASVYATFQEKVDGNTIANGIKTFYINVPGSGTYVNTVTIGDNAEGAALANADVYVVTIEADAAGDYPVSVDLSMLPDAVIGAGWTPTADGVIESIDVAGGTIAAGETVGISSIEFVESVKDLKGGARIYLQCITEGEANDGFDVVDEACGGKSYDQDSTESEISLTANQIAGDFMRLHPNAREIEDTTTYVYVTAEREVESYTDADGNVYGSIKITDAESQDCGTISVINPDNCGGSIMQEIAVNNGVSLDKSCFIVLSGNNGTDSEGRILFSEDLIGTTLAVEYQKAVEAEQAYEVGTNFRDTRVRITLRVCYKNGRIEQRIYHNVLLTQFPFGFSSSDGTERELTFVVSPDDNGVRYTTHLLAAGTV